MEGKSLQVEGAQMAPELLVSYGLMKEKKAKKQAGPRRRWMRR